MKTSETAQSFIHELSNLYVPYFDVTRDTQIGEFPLAFRAEYRRRDERYMFTKKVKVWRVENQQVIFAACPNEPIDQSYLEEFQQAIKNHMDDYLPLKTEHMSTIFVGVIITNQALDQKVINKTKKIRKVKFLKFGMYGWAEIYLAIIDLSSNQIFIHRKGKPFVEGIEKMIKEEKAL
ncbi:MAG TPA: hypothetical protein VEY51_10025 [Chondromyces sp.]|nr:hypothetical protein [Chondromyces sp.]